MRSKALLLGHPLHPMLVPFPVAFLAGAVVFDLVGRLAGASSWWRTGAYLSAGGIGTAIIAALPGLIDYLFTVPPNSSGQRRATKHATANLSAVACFTLAWWIRGNPSAPPGIAVLALEVVGLGVLAVGAYMGGTLVTRNLIGVDHRYANAGKWREQTFDPSPGDTTFIVAVRDEIRIDQMKLLRIGTRRVVLARTASGYVAFDDRCTHKGGSLAGGVMLCGAVQCLWHGSQFDASTGAVKSGPADKPIRTYAVREEAGQVKLTL
jgi:uncharacterized membrane protein/nitrite reductase/ring-hydroxylating ferredoxin subunit